MCKHVCNQTDLCPQETYWDWNSLYCLECSLCPEGSHLIKDCDSYSDRECLYCGPDEFYHNGTCVLCSICEPGQMTLSQCDKNYDTICVNCPSGKYSPNGVDCIECSSCERGFEVFVFLFLIRRMFVFFFLQNPICHDLKVFWENLLLFFTFCVFFLSIKSKKNKEVFPKKLLRSWKIRFGKKSLTWTGALH
jgi:hypothetical protein